MKLPRVVYLPSKKGGGGLPVWVKQADLTGYGARRDGRHWLGHLGYFTPEGPAAAKGGKPRPTIVLHDQLPPVETMIVLVHELMHAIGWDGRRRGACARDADHRYIHVADEAIVCVLGRAGLLSCVSEYQVASYVANRRSRMD